jgi:hypothetical protein
MKSGAQFSLLCRYMMVGSSRPVANSLAEDGGNDMIGTRCMSLPAKNRRCSSLNKKEFMDAEVIHSPELVIGERIPRVIDRHATGRFPLLALRWSLVMHTKVVPAGVGKAPEQAAARRNVTLAGE